MDQAVCDPQDGVDPFEQLTNELASPDPEVRILSAQRLSRFGSPAVAPLCAALRDEDLRVRTAAACALGELQEAQAIGPLAEALRNCFVGRSALRNLIAGCALLVGLIAAVVVMIVTFDAMVLSSALGSGDVFFDSHKRRRLRSELVQAITQALTRIVEQHPSPELRNLLPDLKVVAVDVIQQGRQTRTASREAVAQIEALTARLRDLPLPASGVSSLEGCLPHPAEAPETSERGRAST